MKNLYRLFCSESRPWRALWTVVLLAASGLVSGQELAVENPYKVKAAFLRNFAHYVDWPGHVFSGNAAPWRICVLGRDPFGEVLEMTFKGRTEQGRAFEIIRADVPEELLLCQIVFVAHQNGERRRAALAKLKDKPVLTVGDAPEFLGEGGVIRFQVGDRVHMSINLDQARAVSLTIPTRMLEVSSEVLENGIVRKMR
jgi:hypothetical protein